MDAPIKVAVQYSHRFSTIPQYNKAGAKDLAGFIHAPEINAKKNMSANKKGKRNNTNIDDVART